MWPFRVCGAFWSVWVPLECVGPFTSINNVCDSECSKDSR